MKCLSVKICLHLFALSGIIFIFGNIAICAQEKIHVERNYEFINGNWFNGEDFEKKTFYSVYGYFSSVKPKKIDETVDLKNAYILPPFGDAHNHTLELSYNLESFSNKLFTDGIFYIKNPNSIPRYTKHIADKINRPNTIDAMFAGGGLTATGGHPSVLYNDGLANGPFKFMKIKDFENIAFYFINNRDDLETKWDKILTDKPDFIKTYLLFSEEYDERKDKDVDGFKGLNPSLLPLIVKKAHEAELRVSTHVNSAHDFGVAVRAGVDEINHLPGRFSFEREEDFERFLIKEEDAKLAGEKGIYVVPTYSLFLNNKNKDKSYAEKAQEVQRKNLKLLNKYGVKITFGPDSYNQTSQTEAFYIKDLSISSNLELIKMWAEYTPQMIFPNRKIAKLKDGYEASFIAVPENPIEKFEIVKNINYRFKQGFPIEVKKASE